MNLVLLRHATRSSVLEFGSGEPALNSVGLAQAEDLVGVVQTLGKLPPPTLLYASPKLRARQTLTPLSKALHLDLKIFDLLDERRETESLSAFERRVRLIFETFQTQNSHQSSNQDSQATVYLCSHLDVLEAACLLWPTDFSEHEMALSWSTLEYQVFKIQNGILSSGLRGRVAPRG
jgi:phosphohistidine phosphatase SixA